MFIDFFHRKRLRAISALAEKFGKHFHFDSGFIRIEGEKGESIAVLAPGGHQYRAYPPTPAEWWVAFGGLTFREAYSLCERAKQRGMI